MSVLKRILEGLLEFQLPIYLGKSSDNFNNWCTIQAGEVLWWYTTYKLAIFLRVTKSDQKNQGFWRSRMDSSQLPLKMQSHGGNTNLQVLANRRVVK